MTASDGGDFMIDIAVEGGEAHARRGGAGNGGS